ncbi:MAG: ElyC/SanA/YdcF family protein, partial [Bacteroidota bacterium]
MLLAPLKKSYRIFFLIVLSCLALLFACNLYVNIFSGKYLHDGTASVPHNKCGLILGTSKYLIGGGNNQYFDNRIKAAALLFHSGIIERIICSGDNLSDKHYNEPKAMSKALQQLGVPDSVILSDREGLSTR